MVAFPVSRLVVDPERFLDDAVEPMARVGIGVVSTKTSDGLKLRARPTAEEQGILIETFYRPHHNQLLDVVDAELHRDGHNGGEFITYSSKPISRLLANHAPRETALVTAVGQMPNNFDTATVVMPGSRTAQ